MLVIAIAVLAPVVDGAFSVTGPNVRNAHALTGLGVPIGPSAAHPLGVDQMGRDVLARVVYGARSALAAGILGAAIATLLGAAVGFAAGWGGRRLELVLTTILDALQTFPPIVLGLGIGAACAAGGYAGGLIGGGLGAVVFVLALTGFASVAKHVCGHRLVAREAQFVHAVRGLLAPLAVRFVALIPASILLEAALSFLSVGIRPPTADWGQMIAGGGDQVLAGGAAWWVLVFPGVALLVTVAAFRFLAHALHGVLGRAGTG